MLTLLKLLASAVRAVLEYCNDKQLLDVASKAQLAQLFAYQLSLVRKADEIRNTDHTLYDDLNCL